MRSIIIAIVAGFSSLAVGFQVFNQTTEYVYVKEYYHIFNRFNQHVPSFTTAECDPKSTRCMGLVDFRVIKHSDGSNLQIEEPLCTWQGDVGDSLGYFVISPNPAIKPGETGWCKIGYYVVSSPR